MLHKMTDAEYINANFSMFDGPDETEIECRTVEVVCVRKAHPCMCPGHSVRDFPTHMIEPGSRAVVERVIADGAWGACYVCLPCLESWHKHCDRGDEWCAMDRRAA